MNPFFFLTTRRFKNGIRRSFRTPVRGLMTVLIIGYFLFSFASFLFSKTRTPQLITDIPDINLRIAAAVLLFIHLLLFTIALVRPKYSFTILSETDVANIYPLPQKTWSVIRYFLFTRSFPLIFLFYCLIGIYLFKFLQMIVPIPTSNTDGWLVSLYLAIYVALLMITLSAVLFWRIVIDIRQEFGLIHKYFFHFSIAVIYGIILFSTFYHIQESMSISRHPLVGLSESTESFPLLIMLFPLHAHVKLLIGQFEILHVMFSFFFWGGLSLAGYRALRAEEPRLYEYAAHMATFRVQMRERLRNPATAVKEAKAKKKESIDLPALFHFFTPKRAAAILWKDGIITWRTYNRLTKGLTTLLVLSIIGFRFFIQVNPIRLNEKIFWGISIIWIFMILTPYCMTSIMVFSETLKKAEVQKPLPVNSMQTVAMHILQWTLMTCIVIVIPFLTAAALFPLYAHIFLFTLTASCSFAYVGNAGIFFIALFNPDMQDPIQRMYAPLFGMAVSMAASAPAILVLVIGFLLHFHMLIILSITIYVNLACAGALHILASHKYKIFLFSE